MNARATLGAVVLALVAVGCGSDAETTDMRGPTGIAVEDDGTLYVAAYNSGIIHRILPDGTLEDFVSDRRFNGINGLTQGPDGTL